MDMQLEEKLLVWIEECRSHMLRVSRKLIICKAKTMYRKRVGDKGFKSNKGWFEKFLKRNDLSLRKKTTVAQKDPPQLISRLVANVMHRRRLSKQFAFGPECIIAMDEIAIWSDMLFDATFATSGKTCSYWPQESSCFSLLDRASKRKEIKAIHCIWKCKMRT